MRVTLKECSAALSAKQPVDAFYRSRPAHDATDHDSPCSSILIRRRLQYGQRPIFRLRGTSLPPLLAMKIYRTDPHGFGGAS
jgi:hypothetical protein